jgi:hypothetical protein
MDEMTEVITEGTTPNEETGNELQTSEVEEPSTAPQVEEQPIEEDSQDTETEIETTDENFSLQFNHEAVNVSKDEAVRLAQYGLFLEKLGKDYSADVKQVMADLDYYATLQNKSVKEIVAELIEGVEKSYREELTFSLGENNPLIDEMVELRKSKNKKTYEDAVSQRAEREKEAAANAEKSASERLAEQFEGLRESFPNIDTVEKIPDTVLKKALKSGDLEKEMLRYELSERKKIEAAKASEEKNKNENVGSQQSTPAEDSVMSAMMKGLWG